MVTKLVSPHLHDLAITSTPLPTLYIKLALGGGEGYRRRGRGRRGRGGLAAEAGDCLWHWGVGKGGVIISSASNGCGGGRGGAEEGSISVSILMSLGMLTCWEHWRLAGDRHGEEEGIFWGGRGGAVVGEAVSPAGPPDAVLFRAGPDVSKSACGSG